MTDNELRNKWFKESGKKAYNGFLPDIEYKKEYVEWLEALVKKLTIPVVSKTK